MGIFARYINGIGPLSCRHAGFSELSPTDPRDSRHEYRSSDIDGGRPNAGDGRVPAHGDGADPALPGPHRGREPGPARGDHRAPGRGRAGGRERRRLAVRPAPRRPRGHPDPGQGQRPGRGGADHGRVARAARGAAAGCVRRLPAARGGRDHPGQGEPVGVGELPVDQVEQRLVDARGPDREPLRARPEPVRLKLGVGGRGLGRAGGAGRGHRDGRLDRLPVQCLRRGRHQADRGPGEQDRHRAAVPGPGHRGPDGGLGRGRGRPADRDGRRRLGRSLRSGHSRRRSSGPVARRHRLHRVPRPGGARGGADRHLAGRLGRCRRRHRGAARRRRGLPAVVRRGGDRPGRPAGHREGHRARVRRAQLRVQARDQRLSHVPGRIRGRHRAGAARDPGRADRVQRAARRRCARPVRPGDLLRGRGDQRQPRRSGLPGAPPRRQPAGHVRGGDADDRAQARRDLLADRQPGLADRLHPRRPQRLRHLPPGRGDRLADDLGPVRLRRGPPGRRLVPRPALERAPPARHRLRLRAGHQPPPPPQLLPTIPLPLAPASLAPAPGAAARRANSPALWPTAPMRFVATGKGRPSAVRANAIGPPFRHRG